MGLQDKVVNDGKQGVVDNVLSLHGFRDECAYRIQVVILYWACISLPGTPYRIWLRRQICLQT